ncbi:MAG: hypothetical protein M0R06_22480 [Sphaerochaeta sp.]|jgi:hypothetical protein|nr:hypothetical protein [Sphaerochaeta sp.]
MAIKTKTTGATGEVADPQDKQVAALEVAEEEPVAEEPETDQTEQPETEAGDESAETSPVVEEKPKQKADTDAAFAKLRREKEATERELQAYRQRERQEQERKAKEDQQKFETQLKADGWTEEAIKAVREIVRQDPEFQTMRQRLEHYEMQERSGIVLQHFNELRQKFPQIQTPDDVDQETWDAYNAASGKIPLSRVYAAVHYEELVNQQRSAGQKDAARKIGSKDHLSTEKSGAGSFSEQDTQIPKDRAAIWRGFFPGIKVSEMRQRERKYQSPKGG